MLRYGGIYIHQYAGGILCHITSLRRLVNASLVRNLNKGLETYCVLNFRLEDCAL